MRSKKDKNHGGIGQNLFFTTEAWESVDFTSMPGIGFMVERNPLQHDVLHKEESYENHHSKSLLQVFQVRQKEFAARVEPLSKILWPKA